MYAVIEDGSRQYRVSEGAVVRLDYRDAEVGTQLTLDRVLAYVNANDTRLGQPLLEGVRVLADVVGHPSTKLYIQHFRRRKNYRRLRGHRQHYTAVKIRHILLPGQEPPAAPPPAPATTSTEPGAQTTPPAPSQAPAGESTGQTPFTPAPPTPAPQTPETTGQGTPTTPPSGTP